jgi:ATP-binding cassette subfamily B protein
MILSSEGNTNGKKLFAFLLILQLISGILPALLFWINGKLIDLVCTNEISIFSFFNTNIKISTIFIILYVILIYCGEIFSLLHNCFSDYCKDLTYKKIQYHLINKISNYPTNDVFENSKTNHSIILAKQNIKLLSEYVSIFSQVLSVIFGLLSALMLGFSIIWWIPIVLLITMIPLMYVRTRVENKIWSAREHYADTFAKVDIYERILTTPEFSKDVRLYMFQGFLKKNWNQLLGNFFHSLNKIRKRGAWHVNVWAIISGVGPFFSFMYVVYGATHGFLTIGELSFLLGIIIQLRGSLACLLYNSSDFVKAFKMSSSLIDLFKMLDHDHTNIIQSCDDKIYTNTAVFISIKNLAFHYPSCEKPIFHNLNLEILKGKKVAIVGENGSGKSTFIKLLCRFYSPTHGNIYWEGSDITTIDIKEYRSNISALFQDFSKFPLSVRENINSIQHPKSDEFLENILMKVGLENLALQLDRILWSGVENGIDLSGGEWQRLALARALVHATDRTLLIFDEPTTALDPYAEHEIMTLIYEAIQDKTSIIISHRLALTRMVDMILVFRNGEIIESGSHTELIALSGEYYKMFNRQASWYT